MGSHHPWTLSSPTLQSGAPSNSAFCKAASNSSRPWDGASRWKFLRVGDLIRMICVEAQVKVLSFVCNRFCLGMYFQLIPYHCEKPLKKKKTSQHLPAAISSEETLFFPPRSAFQPGSSTSQWLELEQNRFPVLCRMDPPQNESISHQTRKGKSSTQKCQKCTEYVSSQEDRCVSCWKRVMSSSYARLVEGKLVFHD